MGIENIRTPSRGRYPGTKKVERNREVWEASRGARGSHRGPGGSTSARCG
jgi:hypothetical protein